MKAMLEGGITLSSYISIIQKFLVELRLTTCCSTSLHTTLLPPTCISIGFVSIFLARASICLGNVAENITVCRSGRILSMILFTWNHHWIIYVLDKSTQNVSLFYVVFKSISVLYAGSCLAIFLNPFLLY